MLIVNRVQRIQFAVEIENINSSRRCRKAIQRLSPFIDDQGILRVGGRIKHSDLPFDSRHPILLNNDRLASLIVHQIHEKNCHPGLNTTLCLLQQNFYILGARRLVRSITSRCYRCFRVRPSAACPPMGDLPKLRVNQAKPFSCSGVDFAGPFKIVMSRYRGTRTQKVYLCIFVCLAVKAVHVEVVTDLTSEAFLAALRRFIARRGRCSIICSDCGTNFVGANKILMDIMHQVSSAEGIMWKFNPPASPHFGGIWESAVKGFKTHLYRTVGDQLLTYEEFTTLTAQIEALLNSRPLCGLSTDPHDFTALTPGHFLTQEPLTAPPDLDLSHMDLKNLSRWKLVQAMHQHFWSRWHREYLQTLYQRSKWCFAKALCEADIGTLVLIKDELLPPLKWKLGRIVKLFPGSDQIARVADVQTATGTLRRPMVKLCPLPTQ